MSEAKTTPNGRTRRSAPAKREPYICGIPESWYGSWRASGKPSQQAFDRAAAIIINRIRLEWLAENAPSPDGQTQRAGYGIPKPAPTGERIGERAHSDDAIETRGE